MAHATDSSSIDAQTHPTDDVAADLAAAIEALEAVDWQHVDAVGTKTASTFTYRLIEAHAGGGTDE